MKVFRLSKKQTLSLRNFTFVFQFLGLFVVLNFIYRNAIVNTYAWSDDYPTVVDPSGHIKHTLRDLRPGYAALLTSFKLVETTSDLQIIRLISITSLTLTCLLVWQILSKRNFGISALIGPLVSAATPPFASLVFFATGFGVLIAQTFAVLSFYCFIRGKIYQSFLGYMFLIFAFLIYPTSSWFFIAIATIVLIFSKDSFKSALRNFTSEARRFVFSGLLAFFLAFAFLKIESGEAPSDRVQVINPQNFDQTIKFFITRFLVQSFRCFFYDRPRNSQIMLEAFIVLLIFVLSLIYSSHSKRAAIKRLNLGIAGVVLMTFPYMLLSYNQIEPRFFTATALFLSLLLFRNFEIILSGIGAKLNIGQNPFGHKFIVSAIICLCLGTSNFLTTNLFENRVRPITNNTRVFLNASLEKCAEQGEYTAIVIGQRSKPWPSFKYLGMFSQATDLASDWVPKNATELVLRESKWKKFTRDNIQVNETIENTPGDYCVIDLNLFEDEINEK